MIKSVKDLLNHGQIISPPILTPHPILSYLRITLPSPLDHLKIHKAITNKSTNFGSIQLLFGVSSNFDRILLTEIN